MKRPGKLSLLSLALVTSLSAALPAVAASDFPSKPIKIVMPVPAGTGLDVMIRVVGEKLQAELGQPILIENRPGGGGLLAAQAVASAPKDGYTLLGGATSIFDILPAQNDALPVDVNRDLSQVGGLISAPMFIAVSPKLGVSNLSEFMKLAKSKPKSIVIGTNGAGTFPHFTAMAMAKQADMPVTVLPYTTGGTPEAIKDIMGGRIQAVVEGLGPLRGALKSGDLVIIGVSAPSRDPRFKDVETVAEEVPGFVAVGLVTLVSPAGVPGDVVDQLNVALGMALRDVAVSKSLTDMGLTPRVMTAAEATAQVASDEKYWWPIVRAVSGK
jgi:tripartite-type tricarboxylate transporter receptor subunit TctC